MEDKLNIMTFDLNISLKNFELKSGQIDLKGFLNLKNHIAGSIQNICKSFKLKY